MQTEATVSDGFDKAATQESVCVFDMFRCLWLEKWSLVKDGGLFVIESCTIPIILHMEMEQSLAGRRFSIDKCALIATSLNINVIMSKATGSFLP